MWNKVSLGFDADEETVNFGSRQMAVFQKSVYETSTLAIISSDDEKSANSNIKISCTKYFGSDPGILIILDCSVFVLNNEATELRSNISFDVPVTCYSINADGSVLFAGLSNGDLCCSLLKTNVDPVLLRNICNFNCENEGTFVRMFLSEHQDKCDLVLIASSGSIYKLPDLNLLEIQRMCVGCEKDDALDTLNDTLTLEYTTVNKSNYVGCKILMGTEFNMMGNLRMLLVVLNQDVQELQLWSDTFELKSTLPLSFKYLLKKLQVSQNGSLIYALTDQGTGLIICPYTFTLLYHQDNVTIQNFEMMKDGESSHMLIFTSNPAAELQIITIPGFKTKFRMNINSNCYLPERQSILEDLIYLEAVGSEDESKKKMISSVHLRTISESQPEFRLERLLNRGKFAEAEQFACTCNLSVESVYKAHLQKLLFDIQPWSNNSSYSEESGLLFKNLFEKIEDTEFVVQCALNVLSSDFNLMKSTLKYAEERIKSCNSFKETSDKNTFQLLYSKLRKALLRFNTFYAISEKPPDVDIWLAFYKTNLIEECQNLLRQGKLKEVMLIWGRHIHELKNQLNFDQVVYFFRAIPSSIPTSQVLQWLDMLLRSVFHMFPKIIVNLVNWSKEKVNIMELLHEFNWIENSIHFLKEILRMIRSNVKVVYPNESQNIIESEFSEDSVIRDFLHYIRILTEMSIMKKNYRISISMLEYTQENGEEVMFTILDKVPVDEMRQFVEGFFQELLSQRNMDADVIISEYIQCLVEGSVNWWYWDEAPWESRVSVLLNCMNKAQEKLNTVLNVLKNSPVPWSTTVTKICEEALKYDNPATRLIYEQKKMVDCKLVLKKYDLKDIKIIQPNFRKIVLFIFQQARETMLEDALMIANTFDSNMCIQVYKVYVQHLIESGNLNGALSFLDDSNLSPKTIINCCESIILRVHCLSGLSIFLPICDNYMEILDTVYSKLMRAEAELSASYEPNSSVISEGVCEQLKYVQFLKRNYKEDFTIRCFTNMQKRNELLEFCLKKILKSVACKKEVPLKVTAKLIELSNCFDYSVEEMYLHFVRLAILEGEINIVIFMSKLLLNKEIFQQNISKQIINVVCLILSLCLKYPNYVSDYNLADFMHQLVAVALNSCPADTLVKGLETAKWFHLAQGSIQLEQSFMLTDKEILNSYHESMSSAMVLKLLNAYCSYLDEISLTSFVPHTASVDENSSQLYIESNLATILSNIVEGENATTSFRVLTILHWMILHNCAISQRDLNDCQMIEQTKSLSVICMTKLLKKLIVSRHLNTYLGTAILHHFDVGEATKWILDSTKRYKYDFHRLHSLTELGLIYFEQNQRTEEWNYIYNLRKRCIWGKQIIEYGISYKEAFRESNEEREQLLLKLMAIQSVTTSVLSKYCKDVGFNFQTCLKAYLRQTLTLWTPEFEIKVNTSTGEKELFVKNTYKKLLMKCREIINLIENRKELYDLISGCIWDQVNYYYYEIYLVLLTLMEENSAQRSIKLFSTYRNVFLFLSSYQRISPPKEYEKEQWYMIYQSTQPLPAISEYRLPFRLIFCRWTKTTSDPWKIIQPELNIKTYSRWFVVLDALELDKNVLCTFAINQMTAERSLADTTKSEWCLHFRYQKLLVDIQACVEHISSLEMSSAALYFVMNNIPPGVDQLAVAKLCFLHVRKWNEEEKTEKSKNGFIKCQKKYLTISTTHILYVHNLGQQNYLKLVLSPVELITALYNDPRISQRHSGDLLKFPDINKAVEEISTLHRKDISKIRLELLEEWLLPENFMVNTSYDETINRVSLDEQEKSSGNQENFLKACYVVERDVKLLSPYLVDIVFDRNAEDSKPTSIRLRALKCLSAVVSEDVLQQISGYSLTKLRDVMCALEFMSELEVLGLTYSLSVFNSCNKMEIARSLLTLKTSRAVCLAANICEHFNVKTPSIWNGILNRMCSHEMVQELVHLLPHLSDIYHTLDLTLFENSWKLVLLKPLETAPAVPSEIELKIIEECIKSVYFCPIIEQINIRSIKEKCSKIGLQNVVTNIEHLNF